MVYRLKRRTVKDHYPRSFAPPPQIVRRFDDKSRVRGFYHASHFMGGSRVCVLRKISSVIPYSKLQISRSERRYVYPSKILNEIFISSFAVTDCKTTNHIRAGCELQTMAIFLNANDRNSKFERAFRLFGRRIRGRQAQKSPTGEVGLFCFPVLSWWL